MIPALATIGYEKASPQAVLAALHAAGIGTLIDVRAVAWSRRGEFCKRTLQAAVEGAGMHYVHLAGLGNPKDGRDAARDGRVDDYRRIFTSHLESPEAQTDLATAANLAGSGPICLMCLERDPAACHRSLVAAALAERLGVAVTHLYADRGEPDLFSGPRATTPSPGTPAPESETPAAAATVPARRR